MTRLSCLGTGMIVVDMLFAGKGVLTEMKPKAAAEASKDLVLAGEGARVSSIARIFPM